MSRTRPLRQESALQISIDQTLLDFHALLRIDKVHKREQASEGVPESGVGRHVAGLHLAVVRAVVDALAIGIDLGQIAGEQERAIQAGVEGAQMVDVGVAHADSAQCLIPAVAAGGPDFVKCFSADFAQVQFSLFNADER